MKISNKDIIIALDNHAKYLENNNDNPYKIRAFHKASRAIKNLNIELNQIEDLTIIPFIGKGIALFINQLLERTAKQNYPKPREKRLSDLFDLPGLGRKRVSELHKHDIFTKKQLVKAIKNNELSELKWLSSSLTNKMLKGKKRARFMRISQLIPQVNRLNHLLKSSAEIEWYECCGDFRRKKETISELCFLIMTKHFEQVKKKIIDLKEVEYIYKEGKSQLILGLWLGIKLKIVRVKKPNKALNLLFKTGSNKHLHQLKNHAKSAGFELKNEGLFKKNLPIQIGSENEIYQHLNLDFIEPELREGRDELIMAETHHLPKLINLQDIKGDLHCHTNATDGRETLEAMVKAAIEKGYDYLAITDHSKHLALTHGLDEKRLLEQIEKIEQLNSTLKNFKILKSIEVDILEDGNLDLSNQVLKKLDLVVASIHSKFNLSESKQTARILKAMENPYFTILGHATGRLINSRKPYPINVEKILKAAKERGCFIELNAQPARLDINDFYCHQAKELGLKIAISSDAHTLHGLNFMELGINQARRGGIEKTDVINCYSYQELKKLIANPLLRTKS